MSIHREVTPMLRLALPLILAEVGWMVMGVVDTVMVGHLPSPAMTISAAALAQVLYNTLAFGVGGVLFGLDTYLSQAHGAGEMDNANRWMWNGVALACALSAVLMGMVWLAPLLLLRLHVDREILAQAVVFLHALNWGTLPLFLYLTMRRYLQAFNHVRPIAAAIVTANVANLLGDWALMFNHRFTVAGHVWLWHGMGVSGAAVSTALARLWLAAILIATVWWLDRRHGYGLRSAARRTDWARMASLIRLGAPVGAQIFVEISIFAAVTASIGTMGALPLAGHEIALNCVSFTFMVPFALSTAGAVRVGQSVGRGDAAAARVAGWTAILFGGGFMVAMSAVLVAIPDRIAGGFTSDEAVIAATVPLLLVGAAFQIFDGVQITASGALRGIGNTHTGLVVLLIGYWGVGMPVGLWLGFHRHMGAVGLWMGLCAGLIVAGVSLIAAWSKASGRRVFARAA